MNISHGDRDLGTGYAMQPSTTRTELTSGRSGHADGRTAAALLAPGRPRRRRHDIPRKVRVLGEDLVLFRRSPRASPDLYLRRAC